MSWEGQGQLIGGRACRRSPLQKPSLFSTIVTIGFPPFLGVTGIPTVAGVLLLSPPLLLPPPPFSSPPPPFHHLFPQFYPHHPTVPPPSTTPTRTPPKNSPAIPTIIFLLFFSPNHQPSGIISIIKTLQRKTKTIIITTLMIII